MHPLFHPLFVEFCSYFNDQQDYFECHEVLEDYWKECAPRERMHPLVGFVQLATGMYHGRRGNTIGALRILDKAKHNLQQNEHSPFVEYIDLPHVLHGIDTLQQNIQAGEAFQPFALKLTNTALQQLVDEQSSRLPSVDKQFLLHKHMLRDRSDILAARAEKIRNNTR